MSWSIFAIFTALGAVIFVLALGVGAMVHGGTYDNKHSTQFMIARVGIQALAVLLILFVIIQKAWF